MIRFLILGSIHFSSSVDGTLTDVNTFASSWNEVPTAVVSMAASGADAEMDSKLLHQVSEVTCDPTVGTLGGSAKVTSESSPQVPPVIVTTPSASSSSSVSAVGVTGPVVAFTLPTGSSGNESISLEADASVGTSKGESTWRGTSSRSAPVQRYV